MNTVSTTLGSAIRQARKARNMSQDELASLVGLSKCQISRVENGLAKSLSTMDAVLKALSLSPVIELKPVKTELTSLSIVRILKKFKEENADKYGIQKIGFSAVMPERSRQLTVMWMFACFWKHQAI